MASIQNSDLACCPPNILRTLDPPNYNAESSDSVESLRRLSYSTSILTVLTRALCLEWEPNCGIQNASVRGRDNHTIVMNTTTANNY